jgi:hypothetical protein
MSRQGVEDPAETAAIAAYLATLRQGTTRGAPPGAA